MDDFNLFDLFSEEVVQAHEQIEREDEPYYEEPSPSMHGEMCSPFRSERYTFASC